MMAGRGAPASRAGELVTDSEKRFLITEPLEGQSLGERLRAPLEIAEAIDIAIGIATGLAAAHRAGVIHSDLKPDNVMIRNDGVVKLLDFGVATLMENPATVSTTTATAEHETLIAGTLPYMAPEQLRGERTDGRTDIALSAERGMCSRGCSSSERRFAARLHSGGELGPIQIVG